KAAYTAVLNALNNAAPNTSPSPTPPVSPSPSPTPPVSPSPPPPVSPSPSPSPSPQPGNGCSATIRTVNSWPGGFQSEVTVRAGNAAISGWTVNWSWSGSPSITQLWGGLTSGSGSSVSVRNESWNGAVPANGSTTFGFTANGSPETPTLTCSAS
ncbi:cellulose binding domain-containing protein, partial [Microbispora sp. CSR-4]|uniref:cellulose binding domain-containing protein n=1 Tax=Microbispora sp. CSR-4 TaxID=2592813 RepID=UPI001650D2D5